MIYERKRKRTLRARDGSPGRGGPPSWRTIVLLGFLALLLVAPFANKAVHIDDMVFLACAEQIGRAPLHPLDFFLDTDGRVESVWRHQDPPLIPYYLAALRALGVRSEMGWHVGFIVFPLLCVASMWDLSVRFRANPALGVWLLVATPAFLVNATTLMLDVPLMAFYLCALAAFVEGYARGRAPLIATAGVFAGLASLTKYAGLSLIPLFAAYELLNGGRLRKTCLAGLVACVLFGTWCVHNLLTHGEIHVLEASARMGMDFQRFGWTVFGDTFVGNLTQLAGAGLIPLVWLLALRRRAEVAVFAAAVIATWIAVRPRLAALRYSPGQQLATIGLAAAGGFAMLKVLWGVGKSALRLVNEATRSRGQNLRADRDVVFLALWFFGLFASNVAFQYAAAKYTVMLLPPLILLLRETTPGPIRRPAFLAAISCAFVGISLFVACGDYKYASVYRDAIPFVNGIRARTQGRVWFRGHWGFQYYMERAGYRILHDAGPSPSAGDRVIIPVFCGEMRLPLAEGLRARLTEETHEFPQRCSVATMNSEKKAGFYSHRWGFLPYAPSGSYWERFMVFQVEKQ